MGFGSAQHSPSSPLYPPGLPCGITRCAVSAISVVLIGQTASVRDRARDIAGRERWAELLTRTGSHRLEVWFVSIRLSHSPHDLPYREGCALWHHCHDRLGSRAAQPRHGRLDRLSAARFDPRHHVAVAGHAGCGADRRSCRVYVLVRLAVLADVSGLPAMLRHGVGFWIALGLSCVLTMAL